jgi:hypothetical protein
MKIVKEHINEKFYEDGDPITDMGIGSKFLRLKRGDILIVKKNMQTGANNILLFSEVTTNNSENLYKEDACIVIEKNINISNENMLKLKLAPFSYISIAKEGLKGNLDYLACVIGVAEIDVWNEYFDVLENE